LYSSSEIDIMVQLSRSSPSRKSNSSSPAPLGAECAAADSARQLPTIPEGSSLSLSTTRSEPRKNDPSSKARATAATAVSSPGRSPRVRFTNLNSDAYCFNGQSSWVPSFINKLLYRFRLYNGYYMLEPHERNMVTAVSLLVLLGCGMYCTSFWSGFRDGMHHQYQIMQEQNNASLSPLPSEELWTNPEEKPFNIVSADLSDLVPQLDDSVPQLDNGEEL
jgi:hypothetical protein